MTYSELLHKVSFEEIAPFLKKYPNADNLFPYQQHYDMLRLMEPVWAEEEDKDYLTIKIEKDDSPEDEDGDTYPLLFAWPIEGQIWENSLAKEIVLQDGIEASNAEIAAACIWGSSFYGFDEEDTDDTFFGWHEDIQAKQLREVLAKYKGHIPSIKELNKLKRSFHKNVKNRMRLHRRRSDFSDKLFIRPMKWRSWKRWVIKEEYKRHVFRIAAFVELVSKENMPVSAPPAEELIETLMTSPEVYIGKISSYTGDSAKRANYIAEIVESYLEMWSCKADNLLLCISTSSEHPLFMEELKPLSETLFKTALNVSWSMKTEDSLGKEMRIDYAYYE